MLLTLAFRAEVSAAASDDDALDGCGADAAGLAGAAVDAMPKLEETGYPIRIHIIGDRRASELDRFGKNFDQSGAKTREFGAGEAAGVARRTDTGMKEALVRVDVTHAMQ